MSDVRLIDANAIVEKLQNYYEDLSTDVYSELIRRDEVSSCIAELINAPTIDAQPMKKGKWIVRGDYASCSLCNGSSGTQFDGVEPVPRFTAYCANCGAQMDGGDEK